MATKLPDASVLGKSPQISADRISPSPNVSGFSMGAKAWADALGDFGKLIASIGTQTGNENADLELSRANSQFLIEQQNAQDELSRETEPDKLGDKYSTRLTSALDTAASGISDPKRREIFVNRYRDNVNAVRINADKHAFRIVAGRENEAADTELERLRELGLKEPDEFMSAEYIRAGDARIEALRKSGYISEDDARTKRRVWGEGYAIQKVQAMPPEQRLEMLRAPAISPSGPVSGAATGYIVPKSEVEAYIRTAATARGIDPSYALRVYHSEGSTDWQSTVTRPDGKREESWGPFQLYTGGGLGNNFQRDTGLDPRDPRTWKQNIDYALDNAVTGGWGPWNGAKAVGITGRMGIGPNAKPLGVDTTDLSSRNAMSPGAAPAGRVNGQRFEVDGLKIDYVADDGKIHAPGVTSRARPFTAIVAHHTGGDSLQSALSTLKQGDPGRGGASFGYHFYVDKDGTIYQGVPLDQRTHHVGGAFRGNIQPDVVNENSIGVSFVGSNSNPTPAQLDASVRLTQALMTQFNIPRDKIFGHGELQPRDRTPGEGMPLVNAIRNGAQPVRFAQARTGTIVDFIPVEKRFQLQRAAEGEIQRENARKTSEMTAEKFRLDSEIKDVVASVKSTGHGGDIPSDRIIATLGPIAEEKYQRDRANAQATWNATHDLSTMNEMQITARLEDIRPKAGDAFFADKQKVYDDVLTQVSTLRQKRDDDPAGSVADDPAVKKAQAELTDDPATVRALSIARYAAQQRAGIPEDYQSPITKEEARTINVPLRRMLPGQEQETLRELGISLQRKYGEDAEYALNYAIRQQRVDADTARAAARIIKRISNGENLSAADMRPIEAAGEVGKADSILGTQQGLESLGATFGDFDPARMPVPKLPEGQSIPAKAIQHLRANPGTAKDFDKQFGAGEAKKILEKYPVQ